MNARTLRARQAGTARIITMEALCISCPDDPADCEICAGDRYIIKSSK